jgi:hypothetical protein
MKRSIAFGLLLLANLLFAFGCDTGSTETPAGGESSGGEPNVSTDGAATPEAPPATDPGSPAEQLTWEPPAVGEGDVPGVAGTGEESTAADEGKSVLDALGTALKRGAAEAAAGE